MTNTITIRYGKLESLSENKKKESDMSSGGTSDKDSPLALLDMMGITHAVKLARHIGEDIVFFAEFVSKIPTTIFNDKAYDENVKKYRESRQNQDKKFEEWTDKSFTTNFVFTFGNTIDGISPGEKMIYPMAGFIGETFYDFMSDTTGTITSSIGNIVRNYFKTKLFGDIYAVGLNGVLSIMDSIYTSIPNFISDVFSGFNNMSLQGALNKLKNGYNFLSSQELTGVLEKLLEKFSNLGGDPRSFSDVAKGVYNDHFKASFSNTIFNDIKMWAESRATK